MSRPIIVEDRRADPETELALDALLSELRVQHRKTMNEERHGWWLKRREKWLRYDIAVRPDLDLRLDFELYADQLNVTFNDCYLMHELSAYHGRATSPLASWRKDAVELVRQILTSDLKIEADWSRRNRLLGGRLHCWDGQRWVELGGAGRMWPARTSVAEYRSWLV